MRLRALSAATLAIAVGVAPAAGAAKNPTASQRAEIAESIATPAVCLTINVSTARSGWASYTFRDSRSTRKQCARFGSNGVTLLQRSGKSWRQRWAGSDCPARAPRNVPAAVWRDLTRGHCGR